MRHDKVGAHLRYSICKAQSIETTDKWYTHTHAHAPKTVCELEDVTVLWSQGVHTDREVTANRPDIIIKNKKEKPCVMIDVAIPADRNVTQEEAEKKLKYVQMWNNKCMIIPVIIGATGIVTKGLKKSLEAIPGEKTFSRFTSKDKIITHITESIAV